jgi:putative transposase
LDDKQQRWSSSGTLVLFESFADSSRTELIAERVWRTRSQLKPAIVEHVGWFNSARLHESLGELPPAEFEALHAPQSEPSTPTRTI